MEDSAEAPVPSAAAEPEVEGLGPVLDFLSLLWKVDHGLQACSRRMEELYAISAPQRLVLRIVGLQPGISAGKVAQVLHVHPSTLTGILQRLQARRLLSRKSDPKDARRALLQLTVKGRKLAEPDTGLLEDAVRRVLQRSPHLVGPARDVLKELAQELDGAATGGP
jgi:MarR family transcriptional regulator, organic hydroperoxide resistance regulator